MNTLIPVSESIPTHENHVLVCINSNFFDIDWFDQEYYRWAKVRHPDNKVSHWMEFPALPTTTENTQP